jgi:hypothetical protein
MSRPLVASATFLSLLALVLLVPSTGFADDEGNPSTPPTNPGPEFGTIYPNPSLPPGYLQHSGSSPTGVGSIANTQADSLRRGQTFKATASSLDWVAMVFQYNYQPNTGPMVPAQFRIHVGTGIVSSGPNSGALVNVLGSTDIQAVTPDPATGDSTGWIRFNFPGTVNLSIGTDYYLLVEHVGGYGVNSTGVGIALGSLGSNSYRDGRVWHAVYNRFLNRWEQFAFSNQDFVFALGSVEQAAEAVSVPLPAAAMALAALILASLGSRSSRTAGKGSEGRG